MSLGGFFGLSFILSIVIGPKLMDLSDKIKYRRLQKAKEKRLSEHKKKKEKQIKDKLLGFYSEIKGLTELEKIVLLVNERNSTKREIILNDFYPKGHDSFRNEYIDDILNGIKDWNIAFKALKEIGNGEFLEKFFEVLSKKLEDKEYDIERVKEGTLAFGKLLKNIGERLTPTFYDNYDIVIFEYCLDIAIILKDEKLINIISKFTGLYYEDYEQYDHLDDPYSTIQQLALRFLAEVSEKHFMKEVDWELNNKNSRVAGAAIGLMRKFNSKEAIRWLKIASVNIYTEDLRNIAEEILESKIQSRDLEQKTIDILIYCEEEEAFDLYHDTYDFVLKLSQSGFEDLLVKTIQTMKNDDYFETGYNNLQNNLKFLFEMADKIGDINKLPNEEELMNYLKKALSD